MHEQIMMQIDKLFPELVDIRRYLHQYPELSFQETKTAQFIANYYDKLGIPYEANIGGNGVIARLEGGKPGRTVALRADFDALPIQDEKDVPYKSKIDGVMHACGHDGHTATLLVLAKVMKQFQEQIPGTILFLHQHAEETVPGGAKPILASGALNEAEAVFGTHLWATAPLGELQISKDILMAGTDRFSVTIQGKGGHGAYPHETKDAIVIAANVVSLFQQIVSRRIDPLDTAVITVGQLQAGKAFNVIADTARISGTVRYLNNAIQEQIIAEMESILKGVCISYGAEYKFHYEKGYPPLKNHPEDAQLVMDTASHIQEIKTIKEIRPSMGGEDFAYYLLEKRGAFFFTGAQKDDPPYPHHHPKFDFNEEAMPIAAKTLIQVYFAYQQVKAEG